jgi:NADH:ubiquinone oxidoreductase subunit 6 (subunit J)
MLLETILFWVFATAAVGAALSVVFHPSIIYSALMLIVAFLSIAGVFVLNNADFLAVVQTLVYGVGLTIIILFGIMFTGDKLLSDRSVTKRQFAAYLVVAVMAFAMLLPAALHGYHVIPTPTTLAAIYQTEGSTGLLGSALFNIYSLPFEVASILLLIAMVGAILISKRSLSNTEEVSIKYTPNQSQLPADAQTALEETTTSLAASKANHPNAAQAEAVANEAAAEHYLEREPIGV